MTSTGNEPAALRTDGRVQYFDYLRVIATAGIILLHVAATIVATNRDNILGLFSDFSIGNAYDAFGRFGVNCFFMISGALLLDSRRSFRLWHQWKRVAFPLIVWSAVYVAYNKFAFETGRPKINGTGAIHFQYDLSSAPVAALTGAVAYHLWFVYALLAIYLVVPLLRPITDLAEPLRRHLLLYALALWAVFDVASNFAARIWDGFPKLYGSALPELPVGFLGVFLLGYVLHHYDIPIPRAALILGMFVGFASVAGIVYGEQAYGNGSEWGYDNMLPPALLFSSCVFLLAKGLDTKRGETPHLVALGSRLSFRAYLMHALVLHGLGTLSPLHDWYREQPIISIPALAVLTFLVSFFIAWLIEQIKPIRAYI